MSSHHVTLPFGSRAAKIAAAVLAGEMALGAFSAPVADALGGLKGENNFGATASFATALCLEPSQTLLWRMSKPISCPIAAGAMLTTGLVAPLTGTPAGYQAIGPQPSSRP